ncbi:MULTISPECIES: sulfur carrier protein ThiS [Aliarcobacter]|jgi:sulfur carrier protein|uniref:Thiamine biosynthesis protein n=1 Tax=Aliarcobacter skirrowii CCUG 10374 TaxID=1032239 RepID=A0AAD0SKK3_9BACT|nr:sulfur carrier protein ThiS [Aliarcobacter skirrowii]AXX83926.1 thiamine biosynthesis protein [Aliarcobacter skirrowii CCUG 10374]KAB0621879.1 sulfur carrier protein ThiS [Aliarcobacter skirrowii CCUG 10374]MCT7446485.1 sulfur carrier protein ThiS [Aliarcobacter skirrowii]MDX4036732.1 sulfur carrier protein ThiS [Aliarcobacter skirrowii]MDX4048048.1 sulfur carrier protein ThiS [Aliarcobacter skirrowii]
MRVNNEEIFIEKEISLYELLISKNFEPSKVAVELNQKIVPKIEYETTFLKNSDVLEIVWFVGGG